MKLCYCQLYFFRSVVCLCVALLGGCVASTPNYIDNTCSIFREKDDWYGYAEDSYQNWGVPIHVLMAIMHQESRFVADAEPPRPWLLGIIPWFRSSSAYGYAQAQDEVWGEYTADAGGFFSSRDDFADASDFVGWYCTKSHARLGISKWDAKNLYLAYHEGWGGYSRKTYLAKPWLRLVAGKVAKRAKLFSKQLAGCKDEFSSSWFWFW